MEVIERFSLNFGCVRLPWADALKVVAKSCRNEFGSEPNEYGTPGAIGGHRARSDEPYAYYQRGIRPGHDGLDASIRMRSIKGDPDWTYFEPPTGERFYMFKLLEELSEEADEPFFKFRCSTTELEDGPNEFCELSILYPTRDQRYVCRHWDYDFRPNTPPRKRNKFETDGPVHPAENIENYGKRLISDRLNEADIRSFIARIGAQVPSVEQTVKAAVFSYTDGEIPIEPIATLDERLMSR